MIVVYDIPIDLPKSYYPAIGEIISRCAILEGEMRVIIWRAASMDNKLGRVLTVGMKAKVLIATMKNVANHWGGHPFFKQEMNSIANRANELVADRNFVAHGVWGYPKNGNRKTMRFHR